MGRIFFLKRIYFLILLSFFFLILHPLIAQNTKKLDQLIEKYSSQFKVEKELVKSLIQISSGGNSRAVSESGAKGLLQLTPSAIKDLGIKDPYDEEENIKGGCTLLKNLMDQFNNTELVVAAFNSGPGQVKKYGKVLPDAETKKFVETVMKTYETLKKTKIESNVYGSWIGTARYTKYNSKPPLLESIVGKTQPFDLEITPYGSGVSLNTAKGRMGDPNLYAVQLSKNKVRVEYKGPNPFWVPIPNTKSTHSMSYVFDLNLIDETLKGEFSCTVTAKIVYNIPDFKMPDGESEINYTMILNLKRK